MHNYNKATGITDYSLDILKEMPNIVEPGDISYNGCFFAHRDTIFNPNLDLFRYPCRFNAYVMLVCTRGGSDVVVNMLRYSVVANTLFVAMINDTIQIEMWEDSEFYVVAVNEDFMRQMQISSNFFSIFFGSMRRPCVKITNDEMANIQNQFHSMLDDLRLFRNNKFISDILNSYISLGMHKIAALVLQGSPTHERLQQSTTKDEHYFNRFMELLLANFKAEHRIEFYAAHIFISPKYLTTLIKRVSGRSATDWINDFLIMESKHLLKYSEMDVGDISEYLNFPNQSFFAQYFKRHTGISPSQYRVQL